ncbi:restriction endonuclease subunit S [uncultured Microbulbifer sp.]|uniref:restriction endonuclease subunit S n=1 Tax=uncultured Microbulbifer sp. TaxID=348147 RepID=UPI002635659F|nr:restriction endonuclease subunit S [uncultured Microbulbifer sp.]
MAMVDIADLPRYESYKDSEMLWVDKIPTAWRLEKAKWLFKKAERPVRDIDEIVTCFRDGTVTLRSIRRTEGFTNALKEHGYQGIRKGDLVIHAMDAFAGAIGVSDSDGKATPVYAVCIPKGGVEVNPRFYAYYLRDMALSGFISSLAKGIRERSTDFRFNDFAELLLPIPDFGEQILITSFLDKKTKQIDEAIAIKEQQIALLKERKQFIIQTAVTQGLDLNAPMKDSGVDWIGQIPAHWKVKRLKYMVRFYGGGTPSKDNKDYWGGDISWVSPKDMKMPFISSSIDTITELAVKKSSVKLVEKGAILIVVRGMILAKKIPVAIASKELTINQDMKALVVNDGSFPVFLMCLLDGLHGTLSTLLEESGHGTKTLPTEKLGSLGLPIPPFSEQQKIVTFIENQTHFFEKSIEIQKEQIERLKEYKTTLINSAVTGKIKVTPEMAGVDKKVQGAIEA